jgi:hypothetical protein
MECIMLFKDLKVGDRFYFGDRFGGAGESKGRLFEYATARVKYDEDSIDYQYCDGHSSPSLTTGWATCSCDVFRIDPPAPPEPDWKARFEEADAKRQYWKTRCRRVENDLAQTRRVFRKLVGEG